MPLDPLIILLAFAFGYAASRINLPPLVGYLVAGFVLAAQGYTTGPTIQGLANIGVTILLFTIGLKLNIRSLMRREVWAGATLHMLTVVLLFSAGLTALAAAGLQGFAGLDLSTALVIAFALSFSSTVFAVKILDEGGRSTSLNGRTAIGVLIVQDIFAVLFLTFSTGEFPSPWALAVVAALPAARWVFMRILDRIGHGELQVLFGFCLAFVAGAYAFSVVGLKADLGALVMGMLLAPHDRAEDLAKSLYNIKDFLLVGFFLDIGLSGLPSMQTLGISLLFVLALPIKIGLFFLIFTRFRFRARTAFITAMNLANYSEFGLIVCAVATNTGWIGNEWLLAIAIALSISFVVAAPLNRMANVIFDHYRSFLRRFQSDEYHPDEEPYEAGTWQICIIGMGRIGTGAYDYFTEKYGRTVLGIDFCAETIDDHLEAGRHAALADVTDPAFWRKLPQQQANIKLMLLTIPNLSAQLNVIEQLKRRDFPGGIAAMAQYDDEVDILKKAGVHTSFNIFSEAGIGLASHVCKELDLTGIESTK